MAFGFIVSVSAHERSDVTSVHWNVNVETTGVPGDSLSPSAGGASQTMASMLLRKWKCSSIFVDL
jgi:hypothetical protein